MPRKPNSFTTYRDPESLSSDDETIGPREPVDLTQDKKGKWHRPGGRYANKYEIIAHQNRVAAESNEPNGLGSASQGSTQGRLNSNVSDQEMTGIVSPAGRPEAEKAAMVTAGLNRRRQGAIFDPFSSQLAPSSLALLSDRESAIESGRITEDRSASPEDPSYANAEMSDVGPAKPAKTLSGVITDHIAEAMAAVRPAVNAAFAETERRAREAVALRGREIGVVGNHVLALEGANSNVSKDLEALRQQTIRDKKTLEEKFARLQLESNAHFEEQRKALQDVLDDGYAKIESSRRDEAAALQTLQRQLAELRQSIGQQSAGPSVNPAGTENVRFGASAKRSAPGTFRVPDTDIEDEDIALSEDNADTARFNARRAADVAAFRKESAALSALMQKHDDRSGSRVDFADAGSGDTAPAEPATVLQEATVEDDQSEGSGIEGRNARKGKERVVIPQSDDSLRSNSSTITDDSEDSEEEITVGDDKSEDSEIEDRNNVKINEHEVIYQSDEESDEYFGFMPAPPNERRDRFEGVTKMAGSKDSGNDRTADHTAALEKMMAELLKSNQELREQLASSREPSSVKVEPAQRSGTRKSTKTARDQRYESEEVSSDEEPTQRSRPRKSTKKPARGESDWSDDSGDSDRPRVRRNNGRSRVSRPTSDVESDDGMPRSRAVPKYKSELSSSYRMPTKEEKKTWADTLSRWPEDCYKDDRRDLRYVPDGAIPVINHGGQSDAHMFMQGFRMDQFRDNDGNPGQWFAPPGTPKERTRYWRNPLPKGEYPPTRIPKGAIALNKFSEDYSRENSKVEGSFRIVVPGQSDYQYGLPHRGIKIWKPYLTAEKYQQWLNKNDRSAHKKYSNEREDPYGSRSQRSQRPERPREERARGGHTYGG